MGLEFAIHDAIDGRNGLDDSYEGLIDREYVETAINRRVVDAEWACALSHQAIYARILEQGHPGAVILEDDAILTPRFKKFILEKTYRTAPMVLLDHHIAKFRWHTARRVLPGTFAMQLRRNPVLTTAYSISARAAEHISTRSRPLRGLADWPCDITELGATGLFPRIIGHPKFRTDGSHIEPARNAAIKAARRKRILPF